MYIQWNYIPQTNLEGIMLSEIHQTKKTDTTWYHLYVECKTKTNKQPKAKKTPH